MKKINMFSIKENVVIITGAGRGNGKAIAIGLVEADAIVYALDLAFESESNHPKLFHEVCDITNTKMFGQICEKIYAKHGKIDSLINNAGVTFTKQQEELYDSKNWAKTIEINLSSPFELSQIVYGFMRRNNNGSIVNITSLGADLGFPNNPAYVASKGGLKMLTKAFARDWGRNGIRCNNVGPGYMHTEMTSASYQNETTRTQREQNIMLGRWGTPEDLIGPCIFLISDASAYVTGQDIYVDGGWTANGLQFF
jgi:NAD(P)-dependent dehydrogenase (short-subunit alcohol dehydrogenase family)